MADVFHPTLPPARPPRLWRDELREFTQNNRGLSWRDQQHLTRWASEDWAREAESVWKKLCSHDGARPHPYMDSTFFISYVLQARRFGESAGSAAALERRLLSVARQADALINAIRRMVEEGLLPPGVERPSQEMELLARFLRGNCTWEEIDAAWPEWSQGLIALSTPLDTFISRKSTDRPRRYFVKALASYFEQVLGERFVDGIVVLSNIAFGETMPNDVYQALQPSTRAGRQAGLRKKSTARQRRARSRRR